MFRPCIDLHEGKVKQIVGGTLSDAPGQLRTTSFPTAPPRGSRNSTSAMSKRRSRHHARPRQRRSGALGVARLPRGMHIGGGVRADNAQSWLDAGASHVIVTSWVFRDGHMDQQRWRNWSKLLVRIDWCST